MILKKGKNRIELTNSVQITAYKKAGYEETKPKAQGKPDDKSGAEGDA